MDFDNSCFEILKSTEDFEFSIPEDQPGKCIFAKKFSEWVEKLWQKILTEEPNVISVNQSKVLLLDKFFDFRNYIPRNHRNRVGDRGHVCVFQVFSQTYEKLKLIELSITPPMLFIPPGSPPEPLLDGFRGTLIGFEDE